MAAKDEVLCEMRKGLVVAGDAVIREITCYSRHLVETYSHTWKILSFNEIPFVAKYPMYSPTFNLGKKGSESAFQVVMTKHLYCTNKKKAKIADSDEGDEESDLDSESEDEVSVVAAEGEDISESTSEISTQSKESEMSSEPVSSLESDNDKKPACEEESKVKPEFVRRLGLRLVKIDDNTTWDVVKYWFTLKSSDGTTTVSTKEREEPGSSDYEGKPLYAYLTEEAFGEVDFFEENKLEVICNISYSYIEGNPHETPKICEGQKFADDLRLLYNSKKFSDVILLANGREIKSHKNILSARSKGFEKLLEAISEKPTEMDRYDLKLEPEVGKAMIKFIYCDEIPEDFPVEKCIQLHEAANTYGVTTLQKACSDYFSKKLDPEVCRDCLGVHRYTEDYIEAIKELKPVERKRIFAKETCVHKPCKMEIED